MCMVCGCTTTHASDSEAIHRQEVAQVSPHGDLHYGAGRAGLSVPGMTTERAIRLEADVLGANDRLAALNRAHFASHGVEAFEIGAIVARDPGAPQTVVV